MDQFKIVLNIRNSINRTFFIKILSVLEYPTLTSFQNNNKTGYDLWYEMAEKRYGEVTDDIYLKKACYLPELTKIVSISFGSMNNNGEGRKINNFCDQDEKTLLRNFSDILNSIPEVIENPYVCGHNITGYDIPFLIKRFLKHKIFIPSILKNHLTVKPWESKIIDTVDLWKFNGSDYMSLNMIACFLDLKYKTLPLTLEEVNNKYYHFKDDRSWLAYETNNTVNINMQLFRKLWDS